MIKIIFAFLAGAVIGSGVGYAVCRHICEKEIQSVKEVYHTKNTEQLTETEKPVREEPVKTKPATKLNKTEVDRINKILDDLDYASENTAEQEDIVRPYQINPDEFGEDETYGQAMLDYYADGTVVDDEGCILTNSSIRNLIGNNVGDMFNQTDEDVIYIRNPAVMVDYMINRNDEPYYKDGKA